MLAEILILAVLVGGASCALTLLMRSIAVRNQLLDVPNERSSHARAMPRGGGTAIVLCATVAVLVLLAAGQLDTRLALALSAGGLAVAAAGFLDDRRSLRASTRLAIHAAAALWALVCLGGMPALQLGASQLSLGAVGYPLGVLAIVWSVNLFNFMDGIDGIAASEAAFVALAGALLTLLSLHAYAAPVLAALVLAAACCGFLLWNWPPASIFMGDVGSGYLGYFIAVLVLAAMRTEPAALWVWLILAGVFVLDATATLMRRLLRGERVYQAHRAHAYQHLARRWGSHRAVTVLVLGVNLAWLLPWALLASLRPRSAALIAAIALTPLIILVLVAGAGRRKPGTR
jgi:glycosyltransferase WbpL